jgi:UDP-galactopyranose mutase
MDFRVVVVGAGFSGAVSARFFAEKGEKVLVIEKKEHTAGHCYDYRNESNISIHKYGPHIFHTKSKQVWDYVKRFSRFFPYQHRVLSYAEGKHFNFPINVDTINKAFAEHLSTNEVEDFLKYEVSSSVFNSPPRNFRDAVVSQVGERLYGLFFEGYTRKQWERDPKELDANLAKRIPVRLNRDDRYFSDQYQGIPSAGYTELIRNILDHENISILLKCDYFSIRESLNPEITVYTGELDAFFDYKFGKLEYRSVRFDLQTMDKEYYQPAAVVNFPNDYDWTRITEFKYFTGEPSPKTTVCFEYPQAVGDPYYVVPTQENMKKREEYIAEVRKLENTKKFVFLGRLAEYKYFNMDEVILNALGKLEAKF